jgi:hypothetical protein
MEHPMAVLVLFDQATAFPSVFHDFIFAVLSALGFPLGFLNLCKALYHMVSAYTTVGNSVQFLFWIFSGALQGCSLSGMIYVSVFDVFVRAFARLDEKHASLTRVCADDVAVVLPTIELLPKFDRIFSFCAEFAGPAIKLSKCKVIPLSVPCVKCHSTVRHTLTELLPSWSCVDITGAAKYLGVYLGPESNEPQFRALIDKMNTRVRNLIII